MSKLPRITADEVIRVLNRAGFFLARQNGKSQGSQERRRMRVTVPYSAGKTLHPKVLQSILRDADFSVEVFDKLRSRKVHGVVY